MSEQPIDKLLAKVKGMKPEEWPHGSTDPTWGTWAYKNPHFLATFTLQQAREYLAARTLLPGLAGMVKQLRIMCSNQSQGEDAGYDRSMQFADFCVRVFNEDAAALLAKLEPKPKETDDD